jgi:Zn-dependent peptidase ImmA (M78 family)
MERDREEIVGLIADIYEEYEISELGFDLSKFCDDAGIVLVPYSSYGDDIDILINYDEDGFNIINPESNSCEIYYNDFIFPEERIKFTIPHEIGHIMLGHNVTLGNETPEQKKEADLFANEFYCPFILLLHYGLITKSKLISTFGITAKYAEVLIDKIKRWVNYDYTKNEKRLLKVFLENKKNKK